MGIRVRQARIFTRTLPVLVWLCAIAATAFLFMNQMETVELRGIAFSQEQSINSVETGYIRSMPVTLYQEVKKGDTLAIIKESTIAAQEYTNELLHAQRATAQSELELLRSELEAVANRLILDKTDREMDTTDLARRLAVDVERSRLDVLEIKTSLEPDKLSLKDIEVEMDIVKSLLKEGAAEKYELEKIEANYAVLKEKITQTEQLLSQTQESYATAQVRKDEFEQKAPLRPELAEKKLAPIRKAILVQENKIRELLMQRDIIILSAPFDGIVNTVAYKPGQTVIRGEPIMTIVKPSPEHITTWVNQRDMDRFVVNTKVKVLSLNNASQSFESQVSRISSSLELIPKRLWRNPSVPEWGRSIQIPIQPSFVCIHNEVVGIKTLRQ